MDPDMDVSPDTEDPEAAGQAGADTLKKIDSGSSIERVTTRSWAETHNYNPVKLFTKLFHEDIEYLLSMGKLWEERRKPVPLTWAELPEDNTQQSVGLLKDQRVWSIQESGGVFMMWLGADVLMDCFGLICGSIVHLVLIL
jgi:ubiquitin-like 1-activating enzyme E1 B